ncbi:MAG TPA: methionine--tRNA ligase [Pirellulaceae bacterium]|nr:methionine--tRNA ligase [Pirellulaceae bacterium]
MTQRRLLVTAALPYTNGPIHLGHLVEYIQTDIWVRFHRLIGNRCIYVCADDTHGTATMIRARTLGRSEEELIREMQAEHERDFAGFDISFDHFGSTHSEANRELCHRVWQSIRAAGLVKSQDVQQLYDVEQGVFLADRFVRGTCPVCRAPDQPGDNCTCGATYSPVDLIDPISTLSGTRPELRAAPHLFIDLEQLHDFLEEWTQSGDHVSKEIANYLKGHFLGDPHSPEGRKSLRPWDISRPAPYFGFEIPDSPGNYWYVWFDAPIGYIASTSEWCQRHQETLADWWESPETEIHHFIGKDIVYFHTLFWPGMLKVARFSLPTKVHVHGFLTVNGEKMSKSSGTFIQASTYLNHLDPSALRYFYASKLGPKVDDLDLNFEEFVAKVNADLVGKVVNLASRSARFVEHSGLSDRYPDDEGLFAQFAEAGSSIAEAYEACDYARAVKLIMELADRANVYVDQHRPWEIKKDPARADELRDVVTVVLNLFRQLIIYLAPILPKLAEKAGNLLHDPIVHWSQSQQPLIGKPVAKFEHLMKRVEMSDVEQMQQETLALNAPAGAQQALSADSGEALAKEPLADECTIEDFAKVDLRIARIVSAEPVENANKLLKLTVSLGGDQQRTVFAGIKAAYRPEQLVGRLVVVVANLKPRQMKFGLSEGMVCAAGEGGANVYLLSPDNGAVPGQRVH